jgi:hypothetical protein
MGSNFQMDVQQRREEKRRKKNKIKRQATLIEQSN